jgi:hypothetical protein
VGAPIVKDGVIVGRGWTQPGGGPMSRSKLCGDAARGAAECRYELPSSDIERHLIRPKTGVRRNERRYHAAIEIRDLLHGSRKPKAHSPAV